MKLVLEKLEKKAGHFTFGFGTTAQFLLVFFAYSGLIGWLAYVVVQLAPETTSPEQRYEYPYWVSVGRQAASGVALVVTAAFFIRWLNWWLRQHTEKELHFTRLYNDFARANWLVETVNELKSVAKEDEVTEIVSLVGHGMFVEPVSEDISTSALEALGNSLKGGSIEAGDLKISLPKGGGKKLKPKH